MKFFFDHNLSPRLIDTLKALLPHLVDFHLLDREIVDLAGAKIGKVDDIEFEIGDDGRPLVAAPLVGQRALGLRIGGRFGAWLAAVATRLRAEEDPQHCESRTTMSHRSAAISRRHSTAKS
ncbi:hypothetical protein ACFQ05_02375 [Amycolatopsis umgeniensis]|uniref:Uncharacterized protein n=1 Tax=Amycolatopsis umgeniensis TaxID=336628 RepID=A0A841B0B4_9PSEU|nr:hypothetical protein [Amycolatopsis umgeniensis]MBB5852105.1 hypothetical protein [Amycolatopsis umgeniensis]